MFQLSALSLGVTAAAGAPESAGAPVVFLLPTAPKSEPNLKSSYLFPASDVKQGVDQPVRVPTSTPAPKVGPVPKDD